MRCGRDQDSACLSVEDNGPGIPAEARDKVFERFFRMPGSPGDGSGLGLAIVKEVVDRHGGTLRVLPAGASGVCISARFPLRPREAPVA